MNSFMKNAGTSEVPTLSPKNAHGEYVCWSRMQAEAGQQIETIVSRKELERRAGNGSFMWGVGNPPAIITGALARAKVPVHVIFSMMKSRPKAVDVAETNGRLASIR